MCGRKRDEVTGGWRTLHGEEPHNVSCLPNVIKLTRYRRARSVYRVLVGKPEGHRVFERPGRRWDDTITVDFKEM
jgi:hypothetical protein